MIRVEETSREERDASKMRKEIGENEKQGEWRDWTLSDIKRSSRLAAHSLNVEYHSLFIYYS